MEPRLEAETFEFSRVLGKRERFLRILKPFDEFHDAFPGSDLLWAIFC